MKTIEERAEEFATKRVGGKYLNPNTSQGTSWLSLNLTYKQIAKEQEAITKQEMINKAKEAYCKASRCGVPRDTCLRLGTCDKYDNFVRMLEE